MIDNLKHSAVDEYLQKENDKVTKAREEHRAFIKPFVESTTTYLILNVTTKKEVELFFRALNEITDIEVEYNDLLKLIYDLENYRERNINMHRHDIKRLQARNKIRDFVKSLVDW